jgi:hypothetical protein
MPTNRIPRKLLVYDPEERRVRSAAKEVEKSTDDYIYYMCEPVTVAALSKA